MNFVSFRQCSQKKIMIPSADLRYPSPGEPEEDRIAIYAIEAVIVNGTIISALNCMLRYFQKRFQGKIARVGAVHLTHPTRTNCREDFVGPEALAAENRHGFQLIWRSITQKVANPPNLPR